jgi:hypothetical protein
MCRFGLARARGALGVAGRRELAALARRTNLLALVLPTEPATTTAVSQPEACRFAARHREMNRDWEPFHRIEVSGRQEERTRSLETYSIYFYFLYLP